MLRFLTFPLVLLMVSCNLESKKNEIPQSDTLNSAGIVNVDTPQIEIITDTSSLLQDREIIMKKKKQDVVIAKKQLENDISKSKLTDLTCNQIFDNYKQLIIKAKKTKSKEDIRKLNLYKSDPNFNKCRKDPENKEIYNQLEKLKRSK